MFIHVCIWIFSVFCLRAILLSRASRVADCHCRDAADAVHSVEKVYPPQVNASSVGHAWMCVACEIIAMIMITCPPTPNAIYEPAKVEGRAEGTDFTGIKTTSHCSPLPITKTRLFEGSFVSLQSYTSVFVHRSVVG